MSSESPSKKIMYPTTSAGTSKGSLPKAHMPKTMLASSPSTLPKDHANQCLPNTNSNNFNPNQYYSLRWNNYQK
jgi:hypothetical protein